MRRTGLDSLEGWFTALICGLILFLMYGCTSLSSLLYVAAMSRYETNRNQASFPFIVCNVLQAATGPFVGYFTKKYSERAIVLSGSVLGFIGIGACFLAETIAEVTVFWGVIFGIGFGFSTLLLPAIINNYFVKHRSTAMGMAFIGSPIGFLIFPPIFEVLLSNYGLSGTFLLLAGINVHCVPLSLFLKKPTFKANSAKIPLNHRKDSPLYLSMSSLNLDPKVPVSRTTPKKSIRGKTKLSRRRFSFEFLWDASSHSTNSCNTVNKQYVLSLDKVDSDIMSRSDNARSYKMINTNVYKNVSVSQWDEFSLPIWHKLERRKINDILKNNAYINFNDSTIGSDYNSKETNLFKTKENCTESKNIKTDSAKGLQKTLRVSNEAGYRQVMNVSSSKSLNKWEQFSLICFSGGSPDHVKTTSSFANSATNCQENLEGYYQVSSFPEVDNIHRITTVTSTFASAGASDKGSVPNSSGLSSENSSNETKGCMGICEKGSLLDVYFSPIFILISIANALFNLQFITLTTVIIDFSRDHNIDSSYEKFIMMCISITGAIGIFGFGWVTDGGYMSRNRFASLSMLVGAICFAVLPMTFGITTFMIVIALWCIVHSCFAPLTPAIIAEYVDEDVQAIAVSAYNVLCAPLYFIIPLLIGYFRDGKGSYDSIFYLLSGFAMLNSVALFIVPWVTKLGK